MNYRTLHAEAEEKLLSYLWAKKHKAVKEYRTKYGIFDVYDITDSCCWEVLTAKIIRSGHEQDEAIIAKIFRYMLFAPKIRFLLVSYDHEELEMFHRMKIEHWHIHNGWWSGRLGEIYYHKGKPAYKIAHEIYEAMISIAPLTEWTKEKRRAKHPDRKTEVQETNDRLGLPKNFLLGLWRDWRLAWVWRLEKVLPKWAKRYGYS